MVETALRRLHPKDTGGLSADVSQVASRSTASPISDDGYQVIFGR
jgi:hypothetical protein